MSRHSIAPKSRYRHMTRAKAEEIRRAYASLPSVSASRRDP